MASEARFHELQPLVEKLDAGQPLSLADFQAVFDAYKAAMADGRLSLMDAFRIGMAVWKILSEFIESTPAGKEPPGFGFQTQAQTKTP